MGNVFFTSIGILFLLTVCSLTLTRAWFLHTGHESGGFSIATTTEFKCQTPGLFPDPYDCRIFYDCFSSGTYTRYRCGPRKRYSVNLQSCVFAFNVACYKSAFRCTTAGDKGAWPGDARIYYVCEVSGTSGKLIPLLFKCPQDLIFRGTACV